MSEKTIISTGVDGVSEDPKRSGQDRTKKTQKRKRCSSVPENLSFEERQARIEALQAELDGLFKYYKEIMGHKVLPTDLNDAGSTNLAVAVLMEESELPLSRLVCEVHNRLKEKENGVVTLASVKSVVLSIGQRLMYGAPNADADVLEDDSGTCLWCWETRDMKLIPKSLRGELSVRRTCRKKVHERIVALSEMINALQNMEGKENCKLQLMRTCIKLCRTFSETDIRMLVNDLTQKNRVNVAEKDAKREEKLLIKQMERNKKQAEKEKKLLVSELEKEKKGLTKDNQENESEIKLLEVESEKDDMKEIFELRKQQRKQQYESEKDRRRREKEEAESRKRFSLQKQASIMERFLKRGKISPLCKNDQLSTDSASCTSSVKSSKNLYEAVTLAMDSTLTSSELMNAEDIRKLQLSSWRSLGQIVRSKRKQRWGIRWKPKTEIFKELKLTSNTEAACDDDLSMDKLVDGWEKQITEDRPCATNVDGYHDFKKHNKAKQLLQFDKSHRPAFYGIWPKKSHVVGARHPFSKDPDLDYDISSDEEWEEEDPGESLSDCEDAEGSLEECSKSDEEESEDGFFVPDGYLSENEGVQADRMETGINNDEAQSSPKFNPDTESEEFFTLLRLQKYLNKLTEHALRKNQPLIITNLMHEKASLLSSENPGDASKLDQLCLQALSLQAIPGNSLIEISVDDMHDEDQEISPLGRGGITTPTSDVSAIPDSDLPTIVSAIQTNSQGMNKVLESLQQKLPAVSKSLLRNKVREISDFVDNHWQVKKEVLAKLGLTISPDKGSRRTKNITTFFSKRCLPPSVESINPSETSPLPPQKPSSVFGRQNRT